MPVPLPRKLLLLAKRAVDGNQPVSSPSALPLLGARSDFRAQFDYPLNRVLLLPRPGVLQSMRNDLAIIVPASRVPDLRKALLCAGAQARTLVWRYEVAAREP